VIPAPLAAVVEAPERAALYIDFDGTLADIVVDPFGARLSAGARDALERLAARVGRMTVISGRPVAFLRDVVDVEGVHLIGQYGGERLVGDAPMVDERMAPFVAPLSAAAEDAERALPDLLVERKGLGVTLHWRAAPDRAAAAIDVADTLAAKYGLATVDGRMAIELRPPVPMNKGMAIAADLDAAILDTVVIAGDDLGDLAMFDALDELERGGTIARAVRIGVASPEGPNAIVDRADVAVDAPARLVALLQELVDAVDARAQAREH